MQTQTIAYVTKEVGDKFTMFLHCVGLYWNIMQTQTIAYVTKEAGGKFMMLLHCLCVGL